MLYLAGWSVMFLSTIFRWTFITWPFFSFMATASVVLTLLSAILGVVCRLNFGKGLARYRRFFNHVIHSVKRIQKSTVNPHQESDGDASDGCTDIKKPAFPTYGQPILNCADDFKPTSQLFFPPGPQDTSEQWVTFPGAVLQHNVIGVQLHRNNSYEKSRSLDSFHSAGDRGHSRNGSQASHTSQAKRWVIE